MCPENYVEITECEFITRSLFVCLLLLLFWCWCDALSLHFKRHNVSAINLSAGRNSVWTVSLCEFVLYVRGLPLGDFYDRQSCRVISKSSVEYVYVRHRPTLCHKTQLYDRINPNQRDEHWSEREFTDRSSEVCLGVHVLVCNGIMFADTLCFERIMNREIH